MSQLTAKKRMFIIPPLYEKIVPWLKRIGTSGCRVGTIKTEHGMLAMVEGTKADVKRALQKLGNYGIIGHCKANGENFKFVGKKFKKIRKDFRPTCDICATCKRWMDIKEPLAGQGVSSCCEDRIVRLRAESKKSYDCVKKEQRRCLKSIYDKDILPIIHDTLSPFDRAGRRRRIQRRI